VDEKKDPFFALNPFMLKDDVWKSKRSEVSSAMTQNKASLRSPSNKNLFNLNFIRLAESDVSNDD
jgi:hypothetical protein